MPHLGRNPDAPRDTSQRKKESNLEAPKKVIVIKWAKQKDTGGKQDPKATSGALPTTAPCHLPDIEKADEGEEQQLGPDVPMRQAPKSEENQSRKRIRCSLCCAKKSANPRVPAAIFSKSEAVPFHSSQNGVSTPFLNIRRPISSRGAAIGSNSASVRDRFNVIPSEVEGSQYVTLKVPQRDSSTSLGMTK